MVRVVRDSTVIQNESGTRFASVNASGQLAVDAAINVGATTVNISGETVRVSATEVSGTFPSIYVTQSGKSVSGIPHRLVVAFSGDTVIAKISGETLSVSVSGNVVNTKISGETVRLISGHNDVNIFAFDPSGLTYNQLWVNTSGGHKLQAVIDAGAITVQVSGNVVYLASGFNPVSLVSGVNTVKVSGESMVVTSGQVEIISGRVSVSGSAVVTSVSGNVVISKISGESLRFGASGFSYADIHGFDYDNTTFRNVAVTQSGEVRIVGSLSASTDISGQIVRAVQEISGGGQVGGFATTSGFGLMGVDVKKTFYKGYQALPITQSSGGTQLLSGNSINVTIKHIGISGVMFIGSSGTNNFPWCNAVQSGNGFPLQIGQSITIEIDNPNKLFVACGPINSSGNRIGYMIQNY